MGFIFFLFSLIATGWISYRYLLPLNDFLTTVLPSELSAIYPDELEISVQDGSVSTNVTEPYFIPMSSLDAIRDEFESKVLGLDTQTINNLLVIDTMAKIEDFPQYQTVALLTKHHLSVMNEDGNIETISLTDSENFILNKQMIIRWVNAISPYLDYLAPILAGLLFLGILGFLSLGKLIYSLFVALILMLVSRFVIRNLSYTKSWQLSLHLVVISTTFFSLWNLVGMRLNFPYLETILLTVLGGLIIKQVVKPKSET